MKNRIYGFLMLIFIFLSVYGFYYYFKVLNNSQIILNSNISNYKVSLYSPKLKINFSTNCLQQKCELIDLIPMEYELIVKKDGYEDYKKNIILEKKTTLELEFELLKNFQSEKVEENFDINFSNDYYKYFNLGNLGEFYVIKNGTILEIYKYNSGNDTKIYDFSFDENSKILLDQVYGNDKYLYINYSNQSYIYDLNKFRISFLGQNFNINYVKNYENNFYFILKNNVLKTDLSLKILNDFKIFGDYILKDEDNIISYINSKDLINKEKFGFLNFEKTILFNYNLSTKKIDILGTINFDIEKIFIEDNKTYFYSNKVKYILEK
ncbi:MAG: hypothetical protein NWP80_00875 [Candidatus Gracilibacteria bacterium]|nr:hypothetical protein [Candidatus Gracilibacteria bacterium]